MEMTAGLQEVGSRLNGALPNKIGRTRISFFFSVMFLLGTTLSDVSGESREDVDRAMDRGDQQFGLSAGEVLAPKLPFERDSYESLEEAAKAAARRSGAGHNDIWRSVELSISRALSISGVGLEHGIACYTRAEEVLALHRAHKAPIEPSAPFAPTLISKALLGLVIQIRGEDYVRKDLEFALTFRFKSLEGTYLGHWRGMRGAGARVEAKTTDWWVNLENLFKGDEVEAICADGQRFAIELRRYRFIDK